MKNKLIPLIICGGSGTRLWPLSRKSLPKQFLKCSPQSNNSFLQETYLRLQGIQNLESPILICNEDHRFIAAEQMREINIKTSTTILEPFGRNTAPAIALGTLMANEIDNQSLILALPADHVIKNIDKFIRSIKQGIKYAEEGYIVAFGIAPNSPETGYGYIEASTPLDFQNCKGIKISKFIEKPEKEIAEQLILNNKYSWNSGIFLMKTNIMLKEYEKLQPEIICKCNESIKKGVLDLDFHRINKDYFESCQDISFDIAIMEKTKLGIVLPLDMSWSDVGSWDALSKISKKDLLKNTLVGNTLTKDIQNCYIRSENRLVVGVDIEDIIVVETTDAVLVTKKGSSQKVKRIVEEMKQKDLKEATSHKKIYRPWGSYLSLAEGNSWQVKRINVKPGASLSLQKHNFRTEHWVVVSGKALVEIDSKKRLMNKNESTFIPIGCKHRLSNPGKEDLILIEVQSGTYLGEDDIIRFEDNYGRKNLFQ